MVAAYVVLAVLCLATSMVATRIGEVTRGFAYIVRTVVTRSYRCALDSYTSAAKTRALWSEHRAPFRR